MDNVNGTGGLSTGGLRKGIRGGIVVTTIVASKRGKTCPSDWHEEKMWWHLLNQLSFSSFHIMTVGTKTESKTEPLCPSDLAPAAETFTKSSSQSVATSTTPTSSHDSAVTPKDMIDDLADKVESLWPPLSASRDRQGSNDAADHGKKPSEAYYRSIFVPKPLHTDQAPMKQQTVQDKAVSREPPMMAMQRWGWDGEVHEVIQVHQNRVSLAFVFSSVLLQLSHVTPHIIITHKSL